MKDLKISDLDTFNGYIVIEVIIPSKNLDAWETFTIPKYIFVERTFDNDRRLEDKIVRLTLKLHYDMRSHEIYQEHFSLPKSYTKDDLFKALKTHFLAFDAKIENIQLRKA